MDINKIGIALAVYKPDIKHFSEQLESIRKQSFGNWVAALTCDSPLGEILAHPEIAPFRTDKRFIWIENEARLGHKKNFEKAIRTAVNQGADAIACSDQDDVWYEEKLAICREALMKAGSRSLVHSDMDVLTETGKSQKTTWQIENRGVHNVKPRDLLVRNVVAGCACLFDSELAKRFPAIPEAAEYHDHWYALVASVYGGVHSMSQPLLAYRQHAANVVGVSPFKGMLWLPEDEKTPRRVINKCRNCWNKSHALAKAAIQAGLPLSFGERMLFLSRADLGVGLLVSGLLNFKGDRALARAEFARAVGKVMDSVPKALLLMP